MGTIKQTNIRIDEKSAAEFRKFCEKQNITQAQGFDYILQNIAFFNAKMDMPNRVREIEEFEHLIKALLVLYLNSLETSDTAEAEELRTLLEKKDGLISALQEELEQLKIALQEKDTVCSVTSDKLEQCEKQLCTSQTKCNELMFQLEQKESSIKTLQKTITEQEIKLYDYEQYQENNTALQKRIEILEKESKEKEVQYAAANKIMETEHKMQISEQTSVLEKEWQSKLSQKNEELVELMKEHQKQLTIQSDKKEELMKENAFLKLEIETLKNKITKGMK